MRGFENKRKNLVILALTLLFSAYQPVFAETADTKHEKSGHEQHAMEWPGVYNGFVPCANCDGVKTSLALNTNNTYILITQYVGKSPRDFTEKGKFTWDESSNKMILTSRDGSATHQYLVGKDTLTQLDASGNKIAGKNADSYILRRIDVTAIDTKHTH